MHADGIGHQGAADDADDAEEDVVGDRQHLGQIVAHVKPGQADEQRSRRAGGHAAYSHAAQSQQRHDEASQIRSVAGRVLYSQAGSDPVIQLLTSASGGLASQDRHADRTHSETDAGD